MYVGVTDSVRFFLSFSLHNNLIFDMYNSTIFDYNETNWDKIKGDKEILCPPPPPKSQSRPPSSSAWIANDVTSRKTATKELKSRAGPNNTRTAQ